MDLLLLPSLNSFSEDEEPPLLRDLFPLEELEECFDDELDDKGLGDDLLALPMPLLFKLLLEECLDEGKLLDPDGLELELDDDLW